MGTYLRTKKTIKLFKGRPIAEKRGSDYRWFLSEKWLIRKEGMIN